MAGRPRKIENFFDAPKSKTTFSEGKKSACILDDYAIRKNIGTKEGTIEHTPTASNHIVNKEYADLSLLLTGGTLTGNITFTGETGLLFSNVGALNIQNTSELTNDFVAFTPRHL